MAEEGIRVICVAIELKPSVSEIEVRELGALLVGMAENDYRVESAEAQIGNNLWVPQKEDGHA